MFKHLLIPLDGSKLAESPLPTASTIARQEQAKVTLLHVIEEGATESVHGERHLTQAGEAASYLEKITQEFFQGCTVERHVHTAAIKDVAKSIVDHCNEMGADVIVLSTHGKSGLKSMLFGSIAQHVLTEGNLPVLLTRARQAGSAPSGALQRIMVLLDGNSEHEAGLRAAVDLARELKCELELLMVVPTLATLSGTRGATGTFLPSSTREMLDMDEDDAKKYLLAQMRSPELKGLAVGARVLRGDPLTEIVTAAESSKPDIIAMATHGKTSTAAFWSGSLTPKLIERLTGVAMLLVPVTSRRGDGETGRRGETTPRRGESEPRP
ncbi:MAG TPA: universal stress protein [Planctomycetota bacterium]|jgi:nucleotide-binding universal stress UspA family protein